VYIVYDDGDGDGYGTFTAPEDDGAPPLGFTFSSLLTPSCAKRASICRMLMMCGLGVKMRTFCREPYAAICCR